MLLPSRHRPPAGFGAHGRDVRRHADQCGVHRLQQGAGQHHAQRVGAGAGHRRAAHLCQRHGGGTTIRADRRIEGVDPGIARCTGQITVRCENTTLLAQA